MKNYNLILFYLLSTIAPFVSKCYVIIIAAALSERNTSNYYNSHSYRYLFSDNWTPTECGERKLHINHNRSAEKENVRQRRLSK